MGRPDLNAFQTKILYHILQCDSDLETVSHISEGVNALHPAVFRAINTLIERGYLLKEGSSSKGRKREIVLTDKTLAVFILRVQHRELVDYLKRPRTGRTIEQIRSRYRLYDTVILLSDLTNFGYENLLNTIYYMLRNNWFDIENTKIPDREEIEELFKIMTGRGVYVFYGANQEWPSSNEVIRIADLIGKFGIDSKRYLKIVLANMSLRLSLDEYQSYTQELLKDLDLKRIMIPELDIKEHNIFAEKLKKISR
ncbi:MAG: hypothetical protein ACRD47_14770, partial [Nitrososphaeraceae archaeon]